MSTAISKREFLKQRETKMVEIRRDAHQMVDELEGSLTVIGLNYSDTDPTEPEGNRAFMGIAGSTTDPLHLIAALKRVEKELLIQTIKNLDDEDAQEFIKAVELGGL